jgi:hypothetical protein
MLLSLRSNRFDATQAYLKQTRQGRPEPLKLCFSKNVSAGKIANGSSFRIEMTACHLPDSG